MFFPHAQACKPDWSVPGIRPEVSVMRQTVMSRRHASRREFIKTTALALPLIAAGCNRLPAKIRRHPEDRRAISSPFATAASNCSDRPYFYIGTNLWYGCYLSDPALPGGRQRLVRELDRLQSIGVTQHPPARGFGNFAACRGHSTRHHARSARLGRGFALRPGFLPRRNGQAQHARDTFRVELLAVVRRLCPIRSLDYRRHDSRPGQAGHGEGQLELLS